MVTTLTAGNANLSDLLADFRASVEAAQQQHASWSASAAKLGRQSSQTSKEAATAGGASAGPLKAADKTLQDLQGRTDAAAVAAAEHIAVVKQLIDLVSSLNRRCNSSNDQLHHLTSAIHQLQSESAGLQAQLVTASENQQDAAMQASQVLDISKHLQSCVEGLARELDSERAAKKRLQKQMDAMQQQMLFQGEALSALQSAAVNTAGEVEELQRHSRKTSESVMTLLSSKSHLHKQLQKMLLVEQQISTDIRDTQTVVAGERAAIRKHVQLVNGRTSQSCKHQKGQLSRQISTITSRLEELEQQLTMLLTARTAAAGAAGSRRVVTGPVNRGHSRSGPTQPHQQQQQQQQQDQQQMMSDLLALLDSEASDLSNGFNRCGQSVAEAGRLIADDTIPQAAAAAGAAAGPPHNAAGSSSTRSKKKKKRGSKRPPWVFEVLERPPQHQDQQQQQQQHGQEELALRKQDTASNSMKRRQVRSSNLAKAVKDRLVAQQQQLEQQNSGSIHGADQPQGVGLGRRGPAVQASKKKRERWIP